MAIGDFSENSSILNPPIASYKQIQQIRQILLSPINCLVRYPVYSIYVVNVATQRDDVLNWHIFLSQISTHLKYVILTHKCVILKHINVLF